MPDLMELADRIYSLDLYGMRDADATPEDIADEMANDPRETIKFLLDLIDELQA